MTSQETGKIFFLPLLTRGAQTSSSHRFSAHLCAAASLDVSHDRTQVEVPAGAENPCDAVDGRRMERNSVVAITANHQRLPYPAASLLAAIDLHDSGGRSHGFGAYQTLRAVGDGQIDTTAVGRRLVLAFNHFCR
jgi:hypothetical protein